jgi:general secretion pathway protein E
MSAADFKAELRSARSQSSAGAGAVLDVLLRSGHAPQTLAPLLFEVGGVSMLIDADAATPEFTHLTREQAGRLRCAIVRPQSGEALLAAEDPWNEGTIRQAARAVGKALSAAAVSSATLQAWLGEAANTTRVATNASAAPADANSPVVRFVDQAVQQAYATGASDVHFECDSQGVTVKHRLDGVLVRFARMDGLQQAEETISRLKVLAKLDITERRLPQDGRFRLQSAAADVDVRVSIMPSVHGEDAVLRLLDKAQLRGAAQAVSLDRLGFDNQDGARIRALALRPSGMLLVTGPTGSGKTTTVYAALAEINTGLEKIITIEDPVEYELPGVLQIPVNEKKGLTFARGLRSILRHDPDRILVGEIRDGETADIAVQSALTGHLVFTTVHANSVSDIVGRFRHFGIDMFGFMSALNGVVVQRLMRRLCPHCRRLRPPDAAEQRWLALAGVAEVSQIASASGCDRCHGTGFKGRFVVAEVHDIDDTVRDLVTGGAPLSALKARARDQGLVALVTRGAQQVAAGETTIEEVRRVVGEPERD